mgnify:CR=1 FL=1
MTDESPIDRAEWLKSLKYGDVVMFNHAGKVAKPMKIRVIDDLRICLIDANNPKGDLANGEVVFRDFGEGPFGETITPVISE